MKYYNKGIEEDLKYLKDDDYLFDGIDNSEFYHEVIIPIIACLMNKGEKQAVNLSVFLAGKYTSKYVSMNGLNDFRIYFERMFKLNRKVKDL